MTGTKQRKPGLRLDRRPVAIPRRYWTTDRWGRLFVGGACGMGLAAAWLWPACQPIAWTLMAAIALQLTVTSLVGWCPIHELVKRLGIPDREEVYARLHEKDRAEQVVSSGV